MALNVLLPPSGIGTRRKQADDQRAARRFAPGLGYPFDARTLITIRAEGSSRGSSFIAVPPLPFAGFRR